MTSHNFLIPQGSDEIKHSEAFIIDVTLDHLPYFTAPHLIEPELVHLAVEPEKFLFIHLFLVDMELLDAKVVLQFLNLERSRIRTHEIPDYLRLYCRPQEYHLMY